MATSRDVLISLYSKAKFLSNQPEGWIADKDTGKLRCFNDAVSVFVHREEKRILGDKNVVQVRIQWNLSKVGLQSNYPSKCDSESNFLLRIYTAS